jgi:hypothetical protein
MADYIFRYKLDSDKAPVGKDPLLEMIRAQLESILNIVIPVEGQREVKIDGFKLLGDRRTIHKIFPQEQESSDFFEEHPLQ